MNFSRLVTAGIFLSLATHAAISAYFSPDPDQVEIAASEGGVVSVIGSLEDLVAGTDGVLEAVEAPLENMMPAENSPELAAVQPKPTPQATQQVLNAAEIASASIRPVAKGVTDTLPVTAETTPQEPLQTEQPKDTAEELKPLETQPETIATASETKVASTTPPVLQAEAPETNSITREPPVQPVIQDTVEAKPLEATAPAPPVKPDPPAETKIAKQQPQRKKIPGSDRSTRRGGEQITSATGRSNANGIKGGKSNDGGTKARSNYNGKVLAKLRRAKRYPAQVRRDHLQGTVTIRFTVTRNGAISGISLAHSSGHQILDQAAIDMVHRAAPMPTFPDDIRGSKLSFTVPVRFSR